MESKEKRFLQEVCTFWTDTEDANAQNALLSTIERYTKLFFDRMNNPDFNPNTTDGFKEEGNLQDILEIGADICPLEKLLSIFDKDIVMSKGLYWAKPTYFALIPGCGHFLYSVAVYIASLAYATSPANTGVYEIEKCVMNWVCEIVGYPETASGITVSGTSMGAMIAYAAARDHLLASLPEHQQDKMPVVYLADHTHGCNQRGLRIVGLAGCKYRYVPSVKNRMVAQSLEAMISEDKQEGYNPFLVIATMGSTAVGALDPLLEIDQITRKHNIWFHVDASYGGFLLLDDSVKNLCQGISSADSITIDFHKGLSGPFGTAALLFKDHRHVLTTKSEQTHHSLYSGHFKDHRPVLSAKSGPTHHSQYSGHFAQSANAGFNFEHNGPFRSFPIWFLLKTLGTEAVKSQMTEKIKLTEYAYTTLSQMKNVSLYMKPDLTIIAFRYDSPNNDATRKWQELMSEKGVICVTDTTQDGHFYIRLCILSFRTHLDTVEKALGHIRHTLSIVNKSTLLSKAEPDS